MLVDAEPVVRHAAANALQIIDAAWRLSPDAQKAIPQLEAALKDSEYWVRESAVKALARIRGQQP
jgi:HEAT repeat protein